MPNRIIRDWTDSAAIDKLSFQEEVLFTRLIMKADDYGNFHRNPVLIRSLAFPRKDGLRSADIDRWLTNLEAAGLLRTYSAKDDSFLHIVNFKQTVRQKRRLFPAPPEGIDSDMQAAFLQPASNLRADGKPETKRNEEETKRNEEEEKDPPSDFASQLKADRMFFEQLGTGWGINRQSFEKMVTAFTLFLSSKNKRHPAYGEFKSHFFNWGANKYETFKSKAKSMVD